MSKKCPPRYRSIGSMICAAVSGPTAISTRNAITRISQANIGIFPSVIPGQRTHRIVVTNVDRGADAADAGNQE